MNELRPAIIRAHENGKGVREIARFLDIEPSTDLDQSRDSKKPEATKTEKEKKLQEVEGISSALKE